MSSLRETFPSLEHKEKILYSLCMKDGEQFNKEHPNYGSYWIMKQHSTQWQASCKIKI